jgi:dihydrofolate reductase
MKFSHVVACSKNRVIGHEGKMPWHLPEDLKLFKKITTGHVVIMGRKTFESIGRPLPQRLNIVVSQQNLSLPAEIRHATSLEEALDLAHALEGPWGHEAFIIGGGQIYTQSLPIVDHIYMSQVPLDVPGDTWYPEIDPNRFLVKSQETIDGATPFTFTVYERKPAAV